MNDKKRDFQPSERTVVTELRTFLVDKHTRSPLTRADQSAYLGNGELSVFDVNVTDTSHFNASVSKCLTVISPSPVILSLTSTGVIPAPEIPSSGYEDATILANDFIIGNDLVISVVDDTSLNAVNVPLLNLSTGETESVTLTRQQEGSPVFVGKIATDLQGTWASFDGILHPENGHEITLMYTDTRSSTGRPKQIKTTVKAISPYHDAEIMVPQFIRIGRPIGVVVKDNDLDPKITSVVLEYNSLGSSNVIELYRAERPDGNVFVGTIDTEDLYLEEGDSLTFRYNDPRDANGFPKIIERQSIVIPETHVTGEVIIPAVFDGYGSHILRLRDLDIIGASVHLIALNERTQKYVPVSCDETVYGSGEFVGQLLLSSEDVLDSLQVLDGDTIKITYVDQNTQTGSSELIEERAQFTVPETPTLPTEPPVFIPGTVDMQVDGLFTLFGSFVGTITVKGLSSNPVRCNIVVA